MNSYPILAYRILLDEVDLTPKIRPRLVSLTLTEGRGDEADQLDMTLDDTDGKLAIPSKGAKITLQFGWISTGLIDKGNFTVDEVEHSGSPDVLTIRARTASLIDNFRQLEEKSFHDTTLGALLDSIAEKHGLVSSVAESLRNKQIRHIDQSKESDASFLRRLGKQYDAVATIKNETLIFTPAGKSKTTSGKDLPLITITRNLGDRHRYHSAERDTYTGVTAYWYDPNRSKRRSVIAGVSGNSKRLRKTYATEKDAYDAATAEWKRLQRGVFTFDMDLALGDPTLMPESPVKVTGYKPQIDETPWIVAKVVHSISNGGYTGHIELETKTESDESDYDKDPHEGVTGVIAKWNNKLTKKSGQEIEPSTVGKNRRKKTPLASAKKNPITLDNVYGTKAAATRAARSKWAEIKERRERIRENVD